MLRYLPTQRYDAHHDFFDPSDYAGGGVLGGGGSYRKAQGLASNRLATVFFYLNDVADGGQTAFPRAGGSSQPSDFRDCTRGLAVRPRKRRVPEPPRTARAHLPSARTPVHSVLGAPRSSHCGISRVCCAADE